MNEATRTVVTGCPLDCPDSCSLEVSVREGRIERIDGRAEGGQPLTQGLICGKVRRMDRHLECPERVTTPLRRVGPKGQGRFEPATWDEALDFIAGKLNAIKADKGPDAIGVLTSARVTNEENYIAHKFTRAVLQTNNIDHCARL